MKGTSEAGQTTVEWMVLSAIGFGTGPVFGLPVAMAAFVLLAAAATLAVRRRPRPAIPGNATPRVPSSG